MCSRCWSEATPRQLRGKRSTTPDGEIEVVSKNSNGDGSVYFEPACTSKASKVRAGYWRASYRDADGKRRTVSGPTRVQAEARREVKLAEIAAMPAVRSRFSRDTTVAELTGWWLDSANPFDLVKAPRAKRLKAGRALSPADARALITASQELRLGAAVTLLFCQGWRVSEVLGLA